MWYSTLRTFLLTMVLICLALSAYLSVFSVSSYAENAGEMFVTITVRQLPPSESLRSRVSLESRYGMWAFINKFGLFELLDLFVSSQSALIQLPRASNDLLILAPSSKRIPLLFVLEARSLPARSINDNLAILISALIPWALSLCSTVIWRTAWLLELVSFASVLSLVR